MKNPKYKIAYCRLCKIQTKQHHLKVIVDNKTQVAMFVCKDEVSCHLRQ